MNKAQEKRMSVAIKNAPVSQMLMWVWWSFFYRKKHVKLFECVEKGMHWRVAYAIAKKT